MDVPYGPRIRAARCFAGLSQPQLASKLGREVQWIKRRENGIIEIADRDLILIADATGVPVEFLRQGFDAIRSEQPSVEERMEALERKMDAVIQVATTRTARGARESTEDSGRGEGRGDAAEPGPRG